jgi:hypothetical protein
MLGRVEDLDKGAAHVAVGGFTLWFDARDRP